MIVGSLFFCTPALHLRPANSIHRAAHHRRSLQTLSCPESRRVHSCAQERSPSPSDSMPCALFAKTPGVSPRASFNFQLSTVDLLSLLNATLTADLRVLTEISRNRPSATPLESILTRSARVTPLGATLTENRGRHGSVLGNAYSAPSLGSGTIRNRTTHPLRCAARTFWRRL
jgi:hypothetical protein